MFEFWCALAAQLAGLSTLVYAVYYRRHFRRDLVLAYMALGMGIFAVTMLLASAGAGLGLGLGLFGVLSIIRLRSNTLTQEEVAYYFISLAIGLINGLHPGAAWVSPALTAGLVAVMFFVDLPSFARNTVRQTITLDRAYPRHEDLVAALEDLLGAKILRAVVEQLDTVRDITVVDARYRVLAVEELEAQLPADSGHFALADTTRQQKQPAERGTWS